MTAATKVNLNVRVPNDIKEALKQYADECEVTLEELAKAVFEHYLENKKPVKKTIAVEV